MGYNSPHKSPVKRVVSMGQHRNGMMGNPFVATVFVPRGLNEKYLAISSLPRIDGLTVDEQRRHFATHTSVIAVNDIADGNVTFGGDNGTGTYGADNWGMALAYEYEQWYAKVYGSPGFESPWDGSVEEVA